MGMWRRWTLSADSGTSRSSMFPYVALDSAALFIDDDPILTCTGAASGVDVCLHTVRKDHGRSPA